MGGGSATGGGGVDAGCPLDTDPAANACAGTTWYLSPSGHDSADGKTPATARQSSLTGLMIKPGDTLRFLPGVYAAVPSLSAAQSGTPACPLLVLGEPDGGSVLQANFTLYSSYTVLRYLTLSTQNIDSITLGGTRHVTLQYLTFHGQPRTGAYSTHIRAQGCDDCTVRESRFEDDDTAPFSGDLPSSRLRFIGNHVHAHIGGGMFVYGDGALIGGNDFTGIFSDGSGYVNLTMSTNTVVTRNVFHDLQAFYSTSKLITGPGQVINNTFANCYGNTTAPLISAGAILRNNLITQADWAVATPLPDGGGYNIFDPSDVTPYTAPDGGALPLVGTDRIAAVVFDGTSYVPSAGSAAIDSADPTIAVPPGGGTRADVGAIERGATPLADGLYCVLDGGQ
jgi:hypothetical protein